MKSLKIFAATSLAILCWVNITSCTKEVPQYELITEGKKITRIEINSSDSGRSIYELSYDNGGKLLQVTYDNNEETKIIDYNWKSNVIEADLARYYLKDGLVRNWDDYRDVTYSAISGQVYEIQNPSPDSYNNKYVLVWDSQTGGLGRIETYYKQPNRTTLQESFSFSYSGNPRACTNYNPIFPILISAGFDGEFLCVAHPELIAARANALPDRFAIEYWFFDEVGRLDSEIVRGTCSYKFDADGYLTECQMNENSASYYAYKTQYIITWE